MLIGVPKEIKKHEYRVGLIPQSVRELCARGHEVIVETHAGAGINCQDGEYRESGARIVSTSNELFEQAEMIVKVKEPQPNERSLLREGQVLFTYLHLAPDPEQARELIDSRAVCIAYETVTDAYGGLPLLTPMSQVAGRLSIQAGASSLESVQGGAGLLLGGVPGVAPARVTVIGGGVVGANAAMMALGLGADVTVLDRKVEVLRHLSTQFGSALKTVYATADAVETCVASADLVIGAVLVAGTATPKLVTRQMVEHMRPGSVLVDVAIDQGGCFETSIPTTHDKPTFIVGNVVHYCVANMPGAVPSTATRALNNVTLPYVIALAGKGYRQALLDDPHLQNGLNVHRGEITCEAVAAGLGYKYMPAADVLAA